jgi:hypothetical protein
MLLEQLFSTSPILSFLKEAVRLQEKRNKEKSLKYRFLMISE